VLDISDPAGISADFLRDLRDLREKISVCFSPADPADFSQIILIKI